MQVNVSRPVKVLDGSFLRINGVDFPIQWITREQYNSMAVKSVSSPIACYGFYDQNFPTGNIYLWPYPTAGSELHLQLPDIIEQFVDLYTNFTMIPGYQLALEYTLAEELSPGIKELPLIVMKKAMLARKAIRRTNVDVPTLNTGVASSSPYGQFIAGL